MIDEAVIKAALDVIALLAKGTLTAGAVTALAWATCEWVLFPLRATSEATRRMTTLAIGMALVFLAHWSNIVNFGSGPQGWGAAVFFGFLGGGLAPRLHDLIAARLPALTNPKNGRVAP